MAESESIGFVLDPNIDDLDTVLALRKSALKLMAEGKTIMEWSGEGTDVKREFIAPVMEVIRETTRFLKNFDPQTYGAPVRNARVFRIA